MASADDKSVISVPSSTKDCSHGDSAPGEDVPAPAPVLELSDLPAMDSHPMVCVQAHRSNQTPPPIGPDIHSP